MALFHICVQMAVHVTLNRKLNENVPIYTFIIKSTLPLVIT